MYDKCAKRLIALAAVLLLTWNSQLFIGAGEGNGYHTKEECKDYKYTTETVVMEETTSQARVIREKRLIKKRIGNVSAASYDVLCRIVQAEAGGEDLLGKQMVADVIINRAVSKKFPNTIEGVVFQGSGGKAQFSPIRDGRYYSVAVTKETREAVDRALCGKDSTGGALYFVNAGKANPSNLTWFENCLSFCTEHGGHRFYK